MKNFDSYYDPPDDPPYCEDGCGDTLVKDINGDLYCDNKFCPTKFQGVEKEMAEALVEYMDKAYTYEQRYTHMRLNVESLEEKIKDLEWKLNNTNK